MGTKNKLVAGVGLNDYAGSIVINGQTIKSYNTWQHMLRRCYDSKYQAKFPTYIGCSVCYEWLNFSNFKVWYDANYKENFELDKDILIQGNKEYGPDTCRFVPRYINNLLLDSGRSRGIYPLGVCKCKQSSGYLMQCNDGSGKQIQRYHKTVEEAVEDYSTTKKMVVKQQADRALAEGSIQMDVYNALINRNW